MTISSEIMQKAEAMTAARRAVLSAFVSEFYARTHAGEPEADVLMSLLDRALQEAVTVARAEEREACATLVERFEGRHDNAGWNSAYGSPDFHRNNGAADMATDLAIAIRSRATLSDKA